MSISERLKLARLSAGFSTAREAVDALGVNYATYAGHENGSSGYRVDTGELYAQRFNVNFDWLMNGRLPMQNTQSLAVQIVGKLSSLNVGLIQYFDVAEIVSLSHLPIGASAHSHAIKIEGYSMGLMLDGALLFYSANREAVSSYILGRMAVVGLNDGSVLLKRIMRGSKAGIYDLECINGPVMIDQDIIWIAHIQNIVPYPWVTRLLDGNTTL